MWVSRPGSGVRSRLSVLLSLPLVSGQISGKGSLRVMRSCRVRWSLVRLALWRCYAWDRGVPDGAKKAINGPLVARPARPENRAPQVFESVMVAQGWDLVIDPVVALYTLRFCQQNVPARAEITTGAAAHRVRSGEIRTT